MKQNTFCTNSPKFITEEGDQIIYPFSPPIYQTELDDEFINELIKEGDKLTEEKHDWRDKLAGNMKTGYSRIYDDKFILKCEPYLLDRANRFLKGIKNNFGLNRVEVFLDRQEGRRGRRIGDLRIDTMWINYQYKNDNNPPHTHRGDLSFVIFLKVPKAIFNNPLKSNSAEPGRIVFMHGEYFTLTGNSWPVEPYEGLMFIFPAKLQHHVPSFYSDDLRISVAGNFVVT